MPKTNPKLRAKEQKYIQMAWNPKTLAARDLLTNMGLAFRFNSEQSKGHVTEFSLELLNNRNVVVGAINANFAGKAKSEDWNSLGVEELWCVGGAELPVNAQGFGLGVWLYETLMLHIAAERGCPIALTYSYPISGNAAAVRKSLARRYVSTCIPDPIFEGKFLYIPTTIRMKTNPRTTKINPHMSWLPLETLEDYLPDMRSQGVSEVARSPRGFVTAYQKAKGDPKKLSEAWHKKRAGFIKRHMAQVKKRKEPLFVKGAPSRRHLALIAWAYSPTPSKV